MTLPILYEDTLVIHEDGSVTGWACALNDHLDAKVPLQECAAPRGDCPRLFTQAFQCRTQDRQ